MTIHRRSHFKDREADHQWLADWIRRIETENNCAYPSQQIETSLGITHIYTINFEATDLPCLLIFPGARTSVLFWDVDNNLAALKKHYRIVLVETNGLPNLSEGNSPDIRTLDYGHWAKEILDALSLDKVFLAGASFGGLICMKLGLVTPERIQAMILLNSAGLAPFSLGLTNLYYNLLPAIFPTKKNIRLFLDTLVFDSPAHDVSPAFMDIIFDYEYVALTRYKDKTQKPYYMGKEMMKLHVDVYVIEGDADLLFPYQRSVDNAQKFLPQLKEVKIFEHVAHGIETYGPAIEEMNRIIERYV